MRGPAAVAVAIACLSCLFVACGGTEERTPLPAPEIALTPEEQEVWAPLPPNREEIPVLLYHAIGPESDFSNEADAAYGVGFEDFAKQMTMIGHAGYETIDLETFVRFVQGEDVELPPRPLLLTFDDARADSWTGTDGILAELGLEWQERVRSDIEWGQEILADHVPGYEPLGFAVPYGSYGQDGTNDERIPADLLGG
jgi:hypothetical protein